MIEELISGGQTGVDRAALDVAIRLDIPHAGWCPRDRRAEDGHIASEYNLRETEHTDYAVRTEWNVRDSDATLILNRGRLEGGTALTVQYARQYGRPYLVVDLDAPVAATAVKDWLVDGRVRRLNVAGPRESKRPGIYETARDFLLEILGNDAWTGLR